MGYGTNIGSSEEHVGGDITKVLFKFNYNTGTDHASKIFRVNAALKSDNDFETALSTVASGDFTKMAGCDLSALLYPYRVASGVSPTMPTMEFTEYNQSILPYHIDLDQTDKVFNRLVGPSGDSMGATVSSDYYLGDTEFLRDTDDVRSVGIRLPLMGVGWGRGTDGGNYPSNGSGIFSGDNELGTDIDPKDYIAAPIDFRYNPVDKVWTCGTTQSRGIITELYPSSGFYTAAEAQWDSNLSMWNYKPSGQVWSHDSDLGPLRELGQFSFVASGTVVSIKNTTGSSGVVNINYFENDRNKFEALIVDSWVNDVSIDADNILSDIDRKSVV